MSDNFEDIWDLWADPDTAPVERRPLDYGKHNVFVSEVEWARSQKQQPMFKMILKVLDQGPHFGTNVYKSYFLNSIGVRNMKMDLITMQVPVPSTFTDATREALSDACLDRKLAIVTALNKTNPKYQNIYINEFQGMAEHAGADAPNDDGEEIPF